MTKEFEARTESEAIQKAVDQLGIDRNSFDVEIIKSEKKGFFHKGSVTIRVHVKGIELEEESNNEDSLEEMSDRMVPGQILEPESENEEKILEFTKKLLSKMGYKADVSINFRRDSKIGLNIESDHSAIIIGRKGKNLDAIQLIVNVFAGNLDSDYKIIIDSENYRMRHEEMIIRSAFKVAEGVRRSGRSKLLEPMNPFERRLVHTALNDFEGVETKSEGEGLYKQVRVIPVR
ncbi:MAG: protein jag [Sphaerochaetaceae bacterium]|nr:protein jag [Sphaerochaetaceae bacterium]